MQGNNQQKPEEQREEKSYIKTNKKWRDFKLHADIISALKEQQKNKPTGVQAQTLEVTTDQDRKKYNYLIRAANGAGKTMAFLLPMINSLRPNLKCSQDKNFRGKIVRDQIFKPQGVILLQNNVLQEQIQSILKQFIEFGQKTKSQKLVFKLGRLDKEGHTPGDIIICQAKSFLNRHQRGNMNLQNCRFVAVDQVDDVYHHDKDSLARVLQIVKESPNTNLITCSATMDRRFLQFYEQNAGKYESNTQTSHGQDHKKITLTGVNNYYSVVEGGQAQLHKYVIKKIFKELYKDTNKVKPQVFMFFNSIDEINRFSQYFETIASDFTTDESEYLAGISKGVIAAKKYEDGKKVDTTIKEKNQIMQKFRNNQTNVLLATNIIARGIDVRNAVLAINIGVPKRTQKDDSIDVDTYLHRVGRTGRHNDKGVALTVTQPNLKNPLIDGMKKVHNLQIKQLKNPVQLVKQVDECILNNSKA